MPEYKLQQANVCTRSPHATQHHHLEHAAAKSQHHLEHAPDGVEIWPEPYVVFNVVRVGQNHIPICGLYTMFLAGKPPNIRSYTVCIYTVLDNLTYVICTFFVLQGATR